MMRRRGQRSLGWVGSQYTHDPTLIALPVCVFIARETYQGDELKEKNRDKELGYFLVHCIQRSLIITQFYNMY